MPVSAIAEHLTFKQILQLQHGLHHGGLMRPRQAERHRLTERGDAWFPVDEMKNRAMRLPPRIGFFVGESGSQRLSEKDTIVHKRL